MTDGTRITDFLKITHRLIAVLEREIEMLRAMKPAELQALQHDKIVLTAAYESQMATLRDHPESLRALAPETLAQVRALVEVFRTTLNKNQAALGAAKETCSRVLRVIAEELEMKRREDGAYSADGRRYVEPPMAGRPPVSVAFDQHL